MSLTEEEIHNKKTKISNHAKRNEKTAWERKEKKLEKIIETKLVPLQEQERELILKKIPVTDEISEVRKSMVETCIHPYDQLVYSGEDGVFICKFCESRINVG